ncbi:sensor domain-containing protein [Sphingobium xenophagum]|uniref:sensor domain-containing protein n=1 Tax=Sphingobium xenophagum TaxID=121428 RepID=UPI0003744FB2|nr:EAL domain-containing protein [Sphingobium xenophagum]
MDRFAERRFDDFRRALDDGQRIDISLHDRNEILFSPVFDHLSPSLSRWIADARGQILATDQDAGLAGKTWRALLDRADRRVLLKAAIAEEQPQPLTVRLPGTDGQRRWCLVRMRRMTSTDGLVRYYGTLEDVHDRHDSQARALERALAESREHYRWSVELSPQVPWTAAPDGAIEEVGPRWLNLTGMVAKKALGTGWLVALHPDDLPRTITIWTKHLASGAPIDIDYRIRLRDGGYRWMRARAAARRDEQGQIVRWYGTLEDVHAQKLALRALADSEERSRLAVQAARLGIWDFDVATGERRWSAEFRAMLGLSEDQPATSELALSIVHPDDRETLRVMLDAVASGAVPPHFEATLRVHRASDGALRWIRSSGWTTRSESGRAQRVIVTFLDVTDQRDAEDRIRWAATHDPMTRLPNRALWQATLDDMAERQGQTGKRFGLLLLDIDDLKRTNDSLGHDAGDALLCAFAGRLAAIAPPDALLGRLGGDEFGLIAPSLTDGAALEAWSAKLIESLRTPHVHNGRSIDCGVSIGGAVFGDHGDRAEDLLKAADLALYASKAAGRGRLTLFHSDLRAQAQQRSSMIGMARSIIADRLVTPYYQPKVDLRNGQVLGYEALLRWHHPRLGLQLPGSIAAGFEHAEIAVALTEQMLDNVLRDVGGWLQTGHDPGRVAINASAADFARGDFADRVLEQLALFAVPPEHLEIEVTETVFLGRGAGQVERALQHFSEAGVRVALDDFGTGFASLSHLKQYPVDILKIDRSFVSNIEEDAGDAAIVDAIVKLGGSFGMDVVAEGVESAAQADRLLAHGCIIGQGFHLGRPQPCAAITPPLAT